MNKNLTTRAKREMAQAKTQLMTPAQMQKAGIAQYSPSYVQKKFTAEMKKLDDQTRNEVKFAMQQKGFTKSDVLTYIQYMNKMNAVRESQIDKIISGQINITGERVRQQFAQARHLEQGGFNYSYPQNVAGVPNVQTIMRLKYSTPKSLKAVMKKQGKALDAEKYTRTAMKKIRADFMTAFAKSDFVNLEGYDKLLKRVKALSHNDFMKFAFGGKENVGASSITAHEIFSGDGTDEDQLDDQLDALFEILDEI